MSETNGRISYDDFLSSKGVKKNLTGFSPVFMPDYLKGFQKECVNWITKRGKGALYQDCGLGKGVQALVWAENIIRKHPRERVLILAPLAVSYQFVREAEKFGLKITQSRNGKVHPGINVTNYEQLKKYNPSDFIGVVCDESAIIKHSNSKTRVAITKFLSDVRYRLLCTATPAPNDFTELGTSSEALGEMRLYQMMSMFFKNSDSIGEAWELKGHAKKRFWQWVSTWARAVRKPSDLGYDDGEFTLPKLHTYQHPIPSSGANWGFFPKLAKTLDEQREERRKTLVARCEKVASLVPKGRPSIAWCHLNAESKLLTKLIPGAVEIEGADKDEVKEERLIAFTNGQIKCLVTKPKIAGFGLNWQHCSDVFFFPSWSYEQHYQAVRRCYRFGQKREVNCHLIYSEREKLVLDGMLKKERQAEEMFAGIVRFINSCKSDSLVSTVPMEIPQWLG